MVNNAKYFIPVYYLTVVNYSILIIYLFIYVEYRFICHISTEGHLWQTHLMTQAKYVVTVVHYILYYS